MHRVRHLDLRGVRVEVPARRDLEARPPALRPLPSRDGTMTVTRESFGRWHMTPEAIDAAWAAAR